MENFSSPSPLQLTSTHRLAIHLHSEYDQEQKLLQSKVWEPAAIMPLSSWLENLWVNYNESPSLLLSDFQELCVWEKLHPSNPQAIKEAWKLLQEWEVPWEELSSYFNPDDPIFTGLNHFKALCRENHCLTHSSLAPQILALAQTKKLSLPLEVSLFGFDQVRPAHETLLKTLFEKVHVQSYSNHPRSQKINRMEFAARENEIRSMAIFAKQQHQLNPEKKIACVIPNLNEVRNIVEAIFLETECAAFNISLGRKLLDYEMISVALELLNWSSGQIDVSRSTLVLQSPYFCAGEEELILGALLDEKLRQTQRFELPLRSFFPLLNKLVTGFPHNSMLHRLQKFSAKLSSLPKFARPSVWSNLFADLLNILNWPSQRSLNSLEFQLLERWKKTQREYSSLDFIWQEIPLTQALTLLKKMLQHTEFQPKTANMPIQILGVLEASGLYFDALWVSSLEQHSWPGMPRPNPCLPYALQSAKKMPHTSAAQELEYTKKITERLMHSGQEIILSCALQDKETITRPSPLIRHYPAVLSNNSEIIFNPQPLESLLDDSGPPILKPEKISGGSQIIKYQSICPFRSFANFRLKAKAFEKPLLGIGKKIRGIWLHLILNRIWSELENQKTLQSKNIAEIEALTAKHIEQVLEHTAATYLVHINPHILSIEKHCLLQLIKKWLLYEKQQCSNSRIFAMETTHQIQLGELNLTCKVDRIDENPQGEKFLIDYKTGRCSPADWMGERPEDPQLPLYLLHSHPQELEAFSGLFFAKITSTKIKFSGMSKDEEKYHWQESLVQWKKAIQLLAEQFSSGYAKVDPLKTKSCAHCQLKPLCRIQNL